jgi:hypothetical protein
MQRPTTTTTITGPDLKPARVRAWVADRGQPTPSIGSVRSIRVIKN